MRSNFLILIVLFALILPAPTSAEELTWNAIRTIHQVSNYTINGNGSYVGAIKIYNINPSNLSKIDVVASGYLLNLSFVQGTYAFGLLPSVTITSRYKDIRTLRTHNYSFTYSFPGSSDSVVIPQYYNSNGYFITVLDRIQYSKNDNTFLDVQQLLNTLYNETGVYNDSNKLLVPPSKTVRISVYGADKIDIDYVIGTATQLSNADQSSSFNTLTAPVTGGSWADWILSNIPFVGDFLVRTKNFMVQFLTIVFSILFFIPTNLDILFFILFSFAMVHGIIVMSKQGTPLDGVMATLNDTLYIFNKTYILLVQLFNMIWKVVQSIGTIKP